MTTEPIYGLPRDPLAELIAEMRSPYAGPGGASSRSIADAIRMHWDLIPKGPVWTDSMIREAHNRAYAAWLRAQEYTD